MTDFTLKNHNLDIPSPKRHYFILGSIFYLLSFLSLATLGIALEGNVDEKNLEPPAALTDTTAVDTDNTAVNQALEDLLEAMKLGNFVYEVEERPDPFMPFISEKVIQSTDPESENGERLTGMRLFEPGQLTLVAIMFTETNPMAMVEDSSHKGYLIHRGTKIGKTGVVTDILPNEVIIKQLSYSMDQVKKYSTMEMILRKEGEK